MTLQLSILILFPSLLIPLFSNDDFQPQFCMHSFTFYERYTLCMFLSFYLHHPKSVSSDELGKLPVKWLAIWGQTIWVRSPAEQAFSLCLHAHRPTGSGITKLIPWGPFPEVFFILLHVVRGTEWPDYYLHALYTYRE
jgi:hypothetical protein